MFKFEKQKQNTEGECYKLAIVDTNSSESYFFDDLQWAALCFYGKIAEIRSRFPKGHYLVMDLYNVSYNYPKGKSNLVMHFDSVSNTVMDSRPVKL